MGLQEYRRRRDFRKTPEPSGRRLRRGAAGGAFLVQKHAARRLHYDVRLELDGVLKSWAVPKGPSLDPSDRRLAVHVEDHPLEYGDFEGVIPEGQYGAGTVLLWDRGIWRPVGDPHEGYRRGKLKFVLDGAKLKGRWMLVRMDGRERDGKDNWLLRKEKDKAAAPGRGTRLLDSRPESVVSGKQLEGIAAEGEVWHARPRSGRNPPGRQEPLVRPKELAGSRRSRLPDDGVDPQLATLVSKPPVGTDWVHELKLDGYRLICRIDRGRVQLFTRKRKDWTGRFGRIADAAALLPVETAILDGEAVVLDPDGTTNFQALQNALASGPGRAVTYFVFDLLYLDGYDLRDVTLEERKRALRALMYSSALAEEASGVFRYSEHMHAEGAVVLRHACDLGVEGIVSKRRKSPYRSGRNRDWLKIKCTNKQEFVIGGFTDPSGGREGFGALLLGLYPRGAGAGEPLRYVGRVGTGFTDVTLRALRQRLDRLERKTPPFSNAPRGRAARGVHWVSPRHVADVSFAGWTADGVLRQASFVGLREDLDPAEVRREVPVAAGRKGGAALPRRLPTRQGPVAVAGVRLTNPERIQYPDSGITKFELVSYFEAVSDWILPHVTDRPLTLVRCPEGIDQACFYQKHPNETFPDFIRRFPVEEKDKVRDYLAVDSLKGVVYLAQVGVLEFHTWSALRDRLERPDRLIVDLDPGPDVPWPQIVEAARDVRGRLAELGLECYVKTTGGKGLHILAPLVRRHTWDEVRSFSRALVRDLVRAAPDRYVATQTKSRRDGKVYLDYLRNAPGATAVAAFSTRARPGAPVSLPLRWDELNARLRPDKLTIRTVPARLANLSEDPWTGYAEIRQSITKLMHRELGLRI